MKQQKKQFIRTIIAMEHTHVQNVNTANIVGDVIPHLIATNVEPMIIKKVLLLVPNGSPSNPL